MEYVNVMVAIGRMLDMIFMFCLVFALAMICRLTLDYIREWRRLRKKK